MESKEIDLFVDNWLKSQDANGHFIPDENGYMMFKKGALSINLPAYLANVIEDFLEEYSQQSQQGGWISVEDRLPEKNKEVLVSVKYQNEPILVYLDNNDKWIGSRETRDWMVDGFCLDSELVKSIEITHWQPLPIPPNSQPIPKKDKLEELEYFKSQREAFCNTINEMEWDSKLRTAADSLLLAYDRLMSKL